MTLEVESSSAQDIGVPLEPVNSAHNSDDLLKPTTTSTTMSFPSASNPLMSPLSEGDLAHSPMFGGHPAFQHNSYQFYYPDKHLQSKLPMTVNGGADLNNFGYLTPVSSPIKSDPPRGSLKPSLDKDQARSSVKRTNSVLLTPPQETGPLPPIPHTPAAKKAKATHKSVKVDDNKQKAAAGNTRGRPKKSAKKILVDSVEQGMGIVKGRTTVQPAHNEAQLLARLDSYGLEIVPAVVDTLLQRRDAVKMPAYDLCRVYEDLLKEHNNRQHAPSPAPSPIRENATIKGLEDRPKKRRADGEPVLSVQFQLPMDEPRLLSPIQDVHSPPSPVIGAYSLVVDQITGQASLVKVPSSATLSAHSSLPSLSSSSSTTASLRSSLSSAYMALVTPRPVPAQNDRRKMSKADVPGMGRVILEYDTLLERLGSDAAEKAIASAQAATVKSALIALQPAVVDAISSGSKNERIRNWLEADVDGSDDEQTRVASFQPFLNEEEDMLPVQFNNSSMATGGKSPYKLRRTALDQAAIHTQTLLASPLVTDHQRSLYAADGRVGCICGRSEKGPSMVKCDACRSLFHLECLNVRNAVELPDIWYCHRCSGGPLPGKKGRFPAAHSHSLPVREPTFVQSSPQANRHVHRFPSNVDYALAPSPSPANVQNMFITPAMQQDPRFAPNRRHVRRPSSAWSSQTPRLSRSGQSSSDFTFSPRTPAAGLSHSRRHAVPSHFHSESMVHHGRPTHAWEAVGTATPSRDADVRFEQDWDLGYSTPPLGYRGKSVHGDVGFLNATMTPSQDFFHTLQTPLAQTEHSGYGYAFDSPQMDRFARQSNYRRHEMAGDLQPAHMPHKSHLGKVQPVSAALQRSASGLGVSIGQAALDDILGI